MLNAFVEGQKNNLCSDKVQKIPGISNDSNNKIIANSKQPMDLSPLGRIFQHLESSKILIVEGADANFIADEGTEIYDSNGAFIGHISMIFGPQRHPHYSISLIQSIQNLEKGPSSLLMGINQQIFYNPVKTKPAEVEESRSTMTDDGLIPEENPDDSFDEEDQKKADILETQAIGKVNNKIRMQHEDDYEDDYEDNVVMEELGNSSNNNNIDRGRKRVLQMILSSSSSDDDNDNICRDSVKASPSTVTTSKPLSIIPSLESSDHNSQNDIKKDSDDSQQVLFVEPMFVLPPKKQHH